MKDRATLTAFSTASAPLLTKKVRFSWRARREPVEPLGQLDVGLVGGDREADVGEPVELVADRLDHARMAVAGVDHADAAAEVDQPVAVGVGEDGAFGVHHGDRGDGRHAARHGLGAAGQQGAALGAGDLGLQVDDAGHGGLEEAWRGAGVTT